jgi:hypothetical protein
MDQETATGDRQGRVLSDGGSQRTSILAFTNTSVAHIASPLAGYSTTWAVVLHVKADTPWPPLPGLFAVNVIEDQPGRVAVLDGLRHAARGG